MDNDCPCCAPPCSMTISPTLYTHMKIRDDGSEIMWIANHGDGLNDIVFDAANSRLYISSLSATNYIDDAYFRRIDPSDSSVVWSKYSPFNEVSAGLALLSGGDVVTCLRSNTSGNFRERWDPTGTSVWKRGSFSYNGVAADSADNLYFVDSGNIATVTRYPSNGLTADWSTSFIDNEGTSLGVGTNGTQVCVVGDNGTAPAGKSLRMLDASGVLSWSKNDNDTLRGAAFLSSGNVVVVGKVTAFPGSPSTSYTTYCYDSSGSLQWAVNHGADVECVAVDASDNVYTGGSTYDHATVRKYDDAGTLLWSFDYLLGRPIGQVNGIAVDNAGYVYLAGTRVDTIVQP